MTNEKQYDLKKRILSFVLGIINFVKQLPENQINRIFVNQIIRSASSIGANYEEADGTPTKRDFIYKMGLVKKEAKETKYWLTLIKSVNTVNFGEKMFSLEQENEELIRIFAKIIINSSS